MIYSMTLPSPLNNSLQTRQKYHCRSQKNWRSYLRYVRANDVGVETVVIFPALYAHTVYYRHVHLTIVDCLATVYKCMTAIVMAVLCHVLRFLLITSLYVTIRAQGE